jgi:hypothetical protein
MKTVLRAMNLECPMPGTRPIIDGSMQSQPNTRPPTRNTQPSGKSYSGASMFGQRNQSRRSSDPHDF